MKSIKKILKTSVYVIIFLIILTLIKTVLEYFNITNYKINNIINIVIPILSFTFGGFKMGKISEKKGWLEGIKLSLFLIVLMFLTTLFLGKFKIDYLIYLIILTVSGMVGAMFGISK